jgi:hypothetical protein
MGHDGSVPNLIQFWLTPWSRVLLEKLTVTQLVKKFPAFYGTRRFITVFTTVCHWPPSRARWLQSTPSHPISLRSILILSSHLRLGLLNGRFHSGSPTTILYAFLISPMRSTWPYHPILHYLITLTIFGEAYKLWSSSLCCFLQPSAIYFLFGPNIPLSSLHLDPFNMHLFPSFKPNQIQFTANTSNYPHVIRLSILKMKPGLPSETSVSYHIIIPCHNPQDQDLESRISV